MAYKYQQNVFDGATYGYVKYNISPDFGTAVAPGETVTITGQAYCKTMAAKSLEVEATATGTYKSAYVNMSIAKATVTTFTIEFPMWTLSSAWGTGRLLSAPIQFVFWSGVNAEGDGTGTVNVSGQSISYLQYRLSVATNNIEFERYSLTSGSYVKDDEGECVMGSLGLSISEGRTVSDITVATARVTSSGDNTDVTLTIPTSVLTAALTSAGYVESSPSLFASIDFDTAYNYTLLFTIGDAYNTYTFSVLVARAFANVHMSGCPTGGVAFGKFSAATEDNPLFECEFPAHFSGDIQQNGKSLFWNPGDQIVFTSNAFSFAGFITGGLTSLCITIPVGKPIRATGATASGYACVRTIKGYLNSGSTPGFDVNASGYTTTVEIANAEAGLLYFHVIKSSAFTNATNNTPIVMMGGSGTPLTITFT